MFVVCQMSGLVENFNNKIFSDTIDVISVKLCLISHWALSVHTTSSGFDRISRAQQCRTVLTEKFMFLSD